MVAPLVGAWIEIYIFEKIPTGINVAPLVGAWIEIDQLVHSALGFQSLPLWERGLKSRLKDIAPRDLPCRSPCGSVD